MTTIDHTRLRALASALKRGGNSFASINPDLLLALLDERDRLRDLVLTLLANDPGDAIADGGHTVLALWRHEARQLLGEPAP